MLETHRCSREELGIASTDSGSEEAKFWPLSEEQKDGMIMLQDDLVCIDDLDLEL